MKIPICTLEHVSIIWGQVLEENRGDRKHGSPIYTPYSLLSLQAFRSLAMTGSPSSTHISSANMDNKSLYAALPIIYGYGCTGLLSQVMSIISMHTKFTSIEDELWLQRILVYIDRRGGTLPEIIILRLAKTVARSAWPGLPFSWKVAISPNVPGFPLYSMSLRLLVNLIAMSHDDGISCPSIARVALRWKIATVVQRRLRVKKSRRK